MKTRWGGLLESDVTTSRWRKKNKKLVVDVTRHAPYRSRACATVIFTCRYCTYLRTWKKKYPSNWLPPFCSCSCVHKTWILNKGWRRALWLCSSDNSHNNSVCLCMKWKVHILQFYNPSEAAFSWQELTGWLYFLLLSNWPHSLKTWLLGK